MADKSCTTSRHRSVVNTTAPSASTITKTGIAVMTGLTIQNTNIVPTVKSLVLMKTFVVKTNTTFRQKYAGAGHCTTGLYFCRNVVDQICMISVIHSVASERKRSYLLICNVVEKASEEFIAIIFIQTNLCS